MPPSVLRPQFALAAILLLAAFLRLFEITTVPPPLHFDEAMNGNDAMENIEPGRILPFYPQNGGREGLYINIETALIYFFGPQAWMLRLPAAIFGILTVWGIYLLAAELFNTPVGLLAAFFTAASFWHVLFSRLGLRAIGAPLFAVWTLYFLLVAIDRALSSRPYLAQAIAGGFLGGLGFYTYIAYRVTPGLIALAMVYGFFEAHRAKRTRALFQMAGVFAAAAAIMVAPLAIYFLQHPDMLPHRSAEISIFNSPMIPAIFMLAAIGAWRLYAWIAPRMPAPALAAVAAALILGVTFETYRNYFHVWADDPNVPKTFDAASVDIVNRINALPLTAPKF